MNSSSCKAQYLSCVFRFAELEMAWLLAIKAVFHVRVLPPGNWKQPWHYFSKWSPVLPPSPCWSPNNIPLKWAGALLVFPEGARWAKASNWFILLGCFSSDVDKNGLHSWHCCTQVSHLSQDSTYFRVKHLMKKLVFLKRTHSVWS